MAKTVPLGLTRQEIQQQEWEVSDPHPGRLSGPGAVLGGPTSQESWQRCLKCPFTASEPHPSPSTTAAAFLAFQAGAPESECENLPCVFLPSSKSGRAWNTACAPRDPPPQVSRVGTQTCRRPAPLQVCSALGAPQGALGWCPPRRRRLPVLEAGNDLCPSGGLGNWFLNIPLPLADSQADSSRRQRG